MKKTILILLFINSLNADYNLNLTTIDTGYSRDYCLDSYNLIGDKFHFTFCGDSTARSINFSSKVADNNFLLTDNVTNDILINYIDGVSVYSNSKKLSDYTLDTTLPLNATYLNALGLSDEDLNFNFALSGIFMSSLFLFGIFSFI